MKYGMGRSFFYRLRHAYWYDPQNVEGFMENDNYIFVWNGPVYSLRLIKAKRTDLVLLGKSNEIIYIIAFFVHTDTNVIYKMWGWDLCLKI